MSTSPRARYIRGRAGCLLGRLARGLGKARCPLASLARELGKAGYARGKAARARRKRGCVLGQSGRGFWKPGRTRGSPARELGRRPMHAGSTEAERWSTNDQSGGDGSPPSPKSLKTGRLAPPVLVRACPPARVCGLHRARISGGSASFFARDRSSSSRPTARPMASPLLYRPASASRGCPPN